MLIKYLSFIFISGPYGTQINHYPGRGKKRTKGSLGPSEQRKYPPSGRGVLARLPRRLKDRTRVLGGSWRQHSRAKPSTAGHFTDQVMFSRNNTQDFMDELFTEEDDAYLRKKARRVDTLGIAEHQRQSLVEHGRERAGKDKFTFLGPYYYR